VTATPKYKSTIIFDSESAERARKVPGFLGEEAWRNDDTGQHSEIYYSTGMDALKQLANMDTHRHPTSRYGEWHGEYRVGISEVQSVYGHPALVLEYTPESPER